MRKKTALFLLSTLVLAVTGRLAQAQIPPEDVADRAKWEEFLRTAKVVAEEQLTGSGAVTNPWVLTLEKDGVTRRALWKNVSGRPKGFIDSWKCEIAAYEMDKLLGLNMIPPTVEARFREEPGSCMLWESPMTSLFDKTERKEAAPPGLKTVKWNMCVYLQRAFDNLIANEDRHLRNVLITNDWKMILIDHSRSFRSSKKFTKDLIYTERHREGPKLMSMLPRAFVENIKALSFERIKGAVGEYLTDDEINAILIRQGLILKEIDRLIKLNGEAQVLYD